MCDGALLFLNDRATLAEDTAKTVYADHGAQSCRPAPHGPQDRPLKTAKRASFAAKSKHAGWTNGFLATSSPKCDNPVHPTDIL